MFCIAYGCDNRASSEVSFHRLPLKKPALLKQVKIFVNCVTAPLSYQCRIVARENEAPIYDKNARVCSDHFEERVILHQCWQVLAHPGGLSRRMLCQQSFLSIRLPSKGN